MRIRIIALCRICDSFYVTKYLLLSKSLPFFFAGLSDYRVPGEEPQHHLWGTLQEAWQPQEAAGTQRAAQQGTGIFEELCFNQCGGFETFLSRSHFSFVFGFRSRSNFSWVVLSSFGSNGTYFIKHQYLKLVFVYYISLPIRVCWLLCVQGIPLNLDDDEFSVHECAAVLKNFLANLPEPLLTDAYYRAHCQVGISLTWIRIWAPFGSGSKRPSILRFRTRLLWWRT